MKIKKEKKERKAKVKPKVTKGCTLSAPLTPLALRAPLEENDLGLRELFGSISGDEVKDEEDLMNSPKADIYGRPTKPGADRGGRYRV
jgi:hypothetical protein